MNKRLTEWARNDLVTELGHCSEAQRSLFKRMYSHNDLDLSISEVVANMPDDKLDWAMSQVINTVAKTGRPHDD